MRFLIKDIKKARVINGSSLQSLLVRAAFGNPGSLKPVGKSRPRKTEEDQVRDHLNKVDIHKSMGPAGMYLWLLRKLTVVTSLSHC